MRVTLITPSDENGKRQIYIDDAPFVSMTSDLIMSLDIHVGDDIDEARLDEITVRAESVAALQKAYTYLSYNALSRKALCDKLRRAGYSDAACGMAADRLEQVGMIDDGDLCERLVDVMRRTKMWGARKVRYELGRRGIPEALIREALEDGFDDTENAIRQIRKKYAGKDPADPKTKAKILAGLSRLGFDYETIRSAMEAWEEE